MSEIDWYTIQERIALAHTRTIFPYALACLFCIAANAQTASPRIPPQDAELFETRIRPVLVRNCYTCHGASQQLSALRVDSREALVKGGSRGPAILPGNPAASLLIKSIRHQDLRMPIGGKLKDHEILAFEEWIRKGAPWPSHIGDKPVVAEDRYKELARTHWAFQPIKTPLAIPGTAKSSRNPIDRFVAEKLTQAGLTFAKPVDRRTLIRRLSYILTGLPPTADDVDRFVSDPSPDAYQRLVERFLASPRFGEHWARHWLDLVRYGETRGYEWNYEIIGAWRYRDYLVRAFNADVPYDQLVREHIAGDLLEKPRLNAREQLNESLIGPAFYRLGEAGHDDCVMFREIALDVIDNQIDTLTKTFQALTVSCARCHDHKLDPIPTEDYYGLYSILNSSRAVTHSIDLPETNAEPLARLRALKAEIKQELAALWKEESKTVARDLLSTQGQRGAAWSRTITESARKWEHPAYPWTALRCETGGQAQWLSQAATKLANLYQQQQAERAAFNREKFQAFGDFSNWFASGAGLANGPAANGEFAVTPSGDEAIAGVFARGLYTNLLSSRLNGALRSPYLPKDKKYLSVRVVGGNLASRRVVIDNCAIGENYKVLENDSPEWIRLDTYAKDTYSKEKQLPVFAELVTRSDNPRIPDRPGVLKPHQANLLGLSRSSFGILDAVLHDIPETPREGLSHILRLFDGPPIRTWEELAQRYERIVGEVVERWSTGSATEDDIRWLDWLVRGNLLSNRYDATPKLSDLVSEYRRVESHLPEPRVVEGLADLGPGKDYSVLVGGNPKNLGQTAPRRFLRNLFGDTPIDTKGSGRRQLAEQIASARNPLTARVMVNRIWAHVFGRGIVSTVDNFGLLGDQPSHPELLDYLASRFIEEGWSIKGMLRLLLSSDTFLQSGEVSRAAREADPENRLLHHYPLRRLEAESIRDSMLLSSGKLQEGMFGPSVDPYRDEAKEYRRLFAGPLDGYGRRSLYLKVTRMEGTKFLDMFDYPNVMATHGSRDITNVPAQALTLMNDPFVIAEAEETARRLLKQKSDSVEQRVHALFRNTLGRSPSGIELERFQGVAAELGSLRRVPKAEVPNSLEIWKDLAHALFNLKEFIYIQ